MEQKHKPAFNPRTMTGDFEKAPVIVRGQILIVP